MISQINGNENAETAFLIQPTRSMTWREAKLFVLAVAFVSFAIGVWFYAHGYPLVLPFSGLEALAVAVAFYIVIRDGEQREVVSILSDTVVVEKGRKRADQSAAFERAWARVELQQSPRRWYPSRLAIASHGRFVELGRFLTNGEREALASALINAIEKNR